MIHERDGYVYYTSELFKQKTIPVEIAQRETALRLDFLATFIPELHVLFRRRGLEALIDVIGSVAAGAADEGSDIDLLIREEGRQDLTRVTEVGIEIRVNDLFDKQLPYLVQYWYDHPFEWRDGKLS